MSISSPADTSTILEVSESKRKRFKKFPKTLMLAASGQCGHDYQTRIQISYSIAGHPVSEKGWNDVEEILRTRKEALASYDCPVCTSTANLITVRERDEGFAAVLGLQPLPHMEGTVQQVEYAEGVRSNILWMGINRYTREILHSFDSPNTAERILLDALKGFSTENNITKDHEETSDFGTNLGKALTPYYSSMWSYRKKTLSPQKAIAIALVLRDTWTENGSLFTEVRPKAWIASKGRPYSPSPVLDTHIITAAVVTSKLCNWSSLAAAEMAYKILSDNSSSQYQNLMTLIRNRGESSWEELLEEATIWDVLS